MPETPAEENLRAEQEWQQRKQRREQACRDKTDKGNSYIHQSTAACLAARIQYESGATLHTYKCTVCPNWHVGKPSLKFRKEQRVREEEHP